MTGVLVRKGNLNLKMDQKKTMKIWGEDGHLQPKERGPGRNQSYSHLDLQLDASRAVRK